MPTFRLALASLYQGDLYIEEINGSYNITNGLNIIHLFLDLVTTTQLKIQDLQYLIVRYLRVETDHEPLKTVFKKSLDKYPLRQRIKINLQNFDFEVKYKPGKELYFADALSRTGVDNENLKLLESELEIQINLIQDDNVMSEPQLENFQNKENEDLELQTMKTLIRKGWPKDKALLNEVAKPYWKYKDELSIINELFENKLNQNTEWPR
ncbi:hypothetical protein FQR65_LT14082 [Abscondita terminalis]|nr:hypothetical protein FQR65_LT14082 [Abscondita terminalis]